MITGSSSKDHGTKQNNGKISDKAGLDPGKVAADHPRVEEIPFSSESQLMTTLHRTEEGILVCVKGAPESLLPRCTQVTSADGERLLSEEDRWGIEAQGQAYAASALRLLGLAYRRLSEIPDDLAEGVGEDLVWVGLAAPRPVKEGLFNPSVLVVITASTLYLTVPLLNIFAYYIHGNGILSAAPQDLEVRARTLLFVSTMLSMMALARIAVQTIFPCSPWVFSETSTWCWRCCCLWGWL